MSGGGASRRELLAGAAAIAGGLLLQGCASGTPVAASHPTIAERPPATRAARVADARILGTALAMERRAIAAYAACIPLLDVPDARWAKAFVGEEIQQAGELAKLLALVGASAPGQSGEPTVGRARDGAQALALLEGIERGHVARYLDWIPRLSPGAARAGAASILAGDAQHLAALRDARGRAPLTSPWVIGPPPGRAPGTRADGRALASLFAAQQLALACAERVGTLLARDGGSPDPRSLVRTLAAAARAHLTATRTAMAVRGARGRPAAALATTRGIDGELARHLIPQRLGALRGPRDALLLLVGTQRVAIGAAYVALSRIADGALARTVAAMMAADAQHEALLTESVHPGDVAGAIPFGVVEGTA